MQVLHAVYDGKVFQPEETVSLPPKTRVRILFEKESEPVETEQELDASSGKGDPYCFLRVAESLKLDGPSDWSEKMHEYLYGENSRGDD